MRAATVGNTVHRLIGLTAGAWILAHAPVLRAADLPNARLELVRSTNAPECTDESQLASELRARMTSSQSAQEPLLLRVSLDRNDRAFVATIRVEGRKQGIRTLRADGPSCDPLHDALMVALLLLLDEDPNKPPAASVPVPVPVPAPAPDPSPAPPPPSAQTPSSPKIPPLWLSAGGALTSGLPLGLSLAVAGDAILRIGRVDIGVGGFWAPQQTEPVLLPGGRPIGNIDLRLAGGRARGCYALLADDTVRVSGCALLVVSALVGEGVGVQGGATHTKSGTVAWILAGAGPDVQISLTNRIGLGISGAILGSTTQPSFFVSTPPPPPTQYDAKLITAWGGLDLRVRIW